MGSRGISSFDPAALRSERVRQDLTQEQLAQMARERGASILRTHVSMYECGKRVPERRTLHAMAGCLNIPLTRLLVPCAPSLALLRLIADLDQSEVADRFGSSQNRMSLIEQGLEALDDEEIPRLASCLGTTSRAVRQALRGAEQPVRG